MLERDLLAILDAGPISAEALAGLSRQRRQAAEIGIAALIAALDALDPDPDLEEGADDEPSLGSLGGCMGAATADQRQWAGGNLHDFEEEDEHGGDILDERHDEDEDEPSLGAPEIHHDQRRWAQGHQSSRELDHDEQAADLGWKQRQALALVRCEAETMLRRHQPGKANASNVIPFPIGQRRAS